MLGVNGLFSGPGSPAVGRVQLHRAELKVTAKPAGEGHRAFPPHVGTEPERANVLTLRNGSSWGIDHGLRLIPCPIKVPSFPRGEVTPNTPRHVWNVPPKNTERRPYQVPGPAALRQLLRGPGWLIFSWIAFRESERKMPPLRGWETSLHEREEGHPREHIPLCNRCLLI